MDPSRFSRNCDESRETLANFSASIDRVCEKRRTKPDRWERTWPRVIALRDCSQGGGGGGEGVKRSRGCPHRGLDVVCRKPGHPANALVGTPGSFVPPSCVTDSPLLARLRSPSRTRFKPAGHAPRSTGHRVADRSSYAKIRVRGIAATLFSPPFTDIRVTRSETRLPGDKFESRRRAVRVSRLLFGGKIRFARNDNPKLPTFLPISLPDLRGHATLRDRFGCHSCEKLSRSLSVSVAGVDGSKDAFAPRRAVSRVPRRATLNDEIFVDGTGWMRCRHTYTYMYTYTRAR